MALPSGTVTFLFTDIEDSTKLARKHPDTWEALRARHDSVLQTAIESNHGFVFQVIGDAFCSAFDKAGDALKAALAAQRELQRESVIRVRMGIHTGEAEIIGKDYHGYTTLSFVQHLMSAGHGGQVLVSSTSESLLHEQLPENATLHDMGEHKFKDMPNPSRVYQVIVPDLQMDFPALRTLTIFPNNLPTQITSFIGREKELSDVKRLLQDAHLLTLIGPGGTGKTRLALQVAGESFQHYPDGVWLVELAPVLDPSLVSRTTALVLGLRYEPQRPILDMLCDYLHEKKMLILLDNCEHLVDACAQMVDHILHTAPNVRIFASSREALGISGEVIYRVPSLGLPDVDHLPALDSLSQFEAIQLFTDRAGSADPSFTLTKVNAPFMAQICHRLDGIPLALELAAAKVHALGVEQIARRLDDRFRLLTGGSRTALERHQTLRATLDWSYNLLLPGEQVLFRRLSVFINGWTLEAAESVCEEKTGSGSIMGDDILNLLEQLINKSLVSVEEMIGGSRYRILETTRQYANEKLVESGESDALRDKHLAYFLTLVETAEPHLRRAEQVEWIKRLDAELENLRAALAWALHRPLAIFVLRLAGALGRYWFISAFYKEGAKWLDHALGREWDETSKAERAARGKAFYNRASIANGLDELEIEGTSASSALTLCEQVGDAWGTAYSRVMLALHRFMRGDMDLAGAEQLLKTSREEFQKLGDTWGESVTLGALAALYYRTEGKAKEYAEVHRQCIAWARKSGDCFELAWRLIDQAGDHISTSEWDQADMDLQEADQLLAELNLSAGFGPSKLWRAYLLFGRGESENAKLKLHSVVDWCRQVGEKNYQSWSLLAAGSIAEQEGNLPGSLELCKNSLNLVREIGLPRDLALISAVLGRLSYLLHDRDNALQYATESLDIVKHDQTLPYPTVILQISEMNIDHAPATAVQLIGYSEKIFQRLPHPKSPITVQPLYDRILAAAQAKLSETEFASAWETGSKMSKEEAVELAIRSLDGL